MPRKKRPSPLDWAIMRDPTPAELRDLLDWWDRHAPALPWDRSKQILNLIGWAMVQVQPHQPWSNARIRYQRVAAVRRAIKRGLPREKAYADAQTQLTETPAACGWEMMKKVFLAEEKARRRRPR
jgi:hypothetical protein